MGTLRFEYDCTLSICITSLEPSVHHVLQQILRLQKQLLKSQVITLLTRSETLYSYSNQKVPDTQLDLLQQSHQLCTNTFHFREFYKEYKDHIKLRKTIFRLKTQKAKHLRLFEIRRIHLGITCTTLSKSYQWFYQLL